MGASIWHKRAFSLIELSIVLVIIGLLTGGILAGKSLIRASELRAIPNEVTRYIGSANEFRSKYFYLPGDLPNATSFWGTATDCTNVVTNPSSDAKTCDGNGNGQIANYTEVWRLWQHLANAGMIEGTFTGVTGLTGDTTYGVAGSNMPGSKLDSRGGYIFVYYGTIGTGHTSHFPGSYGNEMRFGDGNGVDGYLHLLPSEAWNIDIKMDDGTPGNGKMRSSNNSSRSLCADSDTQATAAYQTSSTRLGCNLIFIPGF